MTADNGIHRIKLKDLDDAFIQRLKAEYSAEDAEVVIHVHPSTSEHRLSEEEFWQIIG